MLHVCTSKAALTLRAARIYSIISYSARHPAGLRVTVAELTHGIDHIAQGLYGFFNHDFWNEQVAEASSYSAKLVLKSVRSFVDTEQFIEDLYDNKIPIDESSRNDYRLRLENKYLRKFVHRFDSDARRETVRNLSREFREELVETGIVDWKKITYRFCGRHMTELRFGEHFQMYELLLADVVELLPTADQEKDLIQLLE